MGTNIGALLSYHWRKPIRRSSSVTYKKDKAPGKFYKAFNAQLKVVKSIRGTEECARPSCSHVSQH